MAVAMVEPATISVVEMVLGILLLLGANKRYM
jgi:hypothetical protein